MLLKKMIVQKMGNRVINLEFECDVRKCLQPLRVVGRKMLQGIARVCLGRLVKPNLT